MYNIKINKQIYQWLVFIIILSVLYIIIKFNFLLFHTLSELLSVVIALAIFTITWNSKKYITNRFFLYIGISFLFIGMVDLFHTITYKGVNIVTGYNANLPTQLWIIARYIESLSFILALIFIKRKMNLNIFFLLFTIVTILLSAAAFYKIFPACYIEGVGLTAFKKISEYIISSILLISISLLLKNKKYFDNKIYRMLIVAIISTIISEISFTVYIDVYGISNIIGHFFKILAFYLFYIAIVHTGIEKPLQLIFRELKKNEQKLSRIALSDELTGLNNRRACYESLRKMMALTKRDKTSLTVCLIDLDNLKKVNDNYGHSKGDQLLKKFANILKYYSRDSDFIYRIGGDEFLLIFPNCTVTDAEKYVQRILNGIKKVNKHNKKYILEFSYGFSEFNYTKKKFNIDKIIEIADKKMYINKTAKKKQSGG